MKPQEIDKKLIEYLEGTLSSQEKSILEDLLKRDSNLQKEFLTLKIILDGIKKHQQETPSPELRINFLEAIKEEKKRQKRKFSFSPQIKTLATLGVAASITLLIIGIDLKNEKFDFFKTEKELAQGKDSIKQILISEMSKNQFASDRLVAINKAGELPIDDELLKSFVRVIKHDNNQNVKIAALRDLENEKEKPSVKEVLFNLTLDHEDPIFQVYAIQFLAGVEDIRNHKILSQLLSDELTNEFVKEEAHMALVGMNNNFKKTDL